MRIKILTLILVGLLAACGTGGAPSVTETPIPPTETIPFVIVTGSGERSTLPPTWTPTTTLTPAPPTETPSPTGTFTPSPTFTADEVCDHFTIATSPSEGRTYLVGDAVQFLYLAEIPGALVRIHIVNTDNGEEQGGVFPGDVVPGGSYQIGSPGVYEWTINVIADPYEEICQESGTFTVVEPPDGSESNPPSEATEEASDAEATIESISDCPEFVVDPQFEDNQEFVNTEVVTILLEVLDPELTMRVVVTYRETGETHNIQIPGGEGFALDLPVELLFGSGIYDWAASLVNEDDEETCLTTGTFIVDESAVPSTPIIITQGAITVTPRATTAPRASATPRPSTATPRP